MKMKLKCSTIFLIICLSKICSAQCIQFTYNVAGNRIQRSYNPTCILSLSDGNGTGIDAQMNALALTVREENDLKAKTDLFPNPAQSMVIIRTDEFSQEAQLAVYNSAGTIVLTRGLTSDQVDISHLIPGLYIFLITEQQGDKLISHKQKIIKQ